MGSDSNKPRNPKSNSTNRNRNAATAEDRFYISPSVRKFRQEQMLLQQQREQQEKDLSLSSSPSVDSVANKVVVVTGGSEDCLSRADSGCSVSKQDTMTVVDDDDNSPALSNLDRFLRNTIPFVTARRFSKTSVRGGRRRPVGNSPPHFVLDDLWESFKEWSAYGAGVPIVLNGNEPVVQYYVPFLSGIQLFVDPSRPSSARRRGGEESDVASSRGTSSDGSCDRDAERGELNRFYRAWARAQPNTEDIRKFDRLSLKSQNSLDGSSPEGESHNPLVYEYLERDSPFIREPLACKISTLASKFPGLRTYRSCDLLPQSWMSVAWYPIYRIPTGHSLQKVDACFLTYHSLSTQISCKDTAISQIQNFRFSELYPTSFPPKLSLPSFALASYRFKASVWDSDGQKEQLLLQAAGNWLRHLQVEHPDYGFFTTHYSR